MMSGFVLAPQNLPFTIALTVMVLMAVLEGVGALFGMAFSTLLEDLFPRMDLNINLPDGEATSAFSRLLGWLHLGQVPILVLLIIFLTVFGLGGLLFQSLVNSFTGFLLPGWLAAVLTVAFTLPAVRVLGRPLAKVLPRDETSAVCDQSFIGRVAVVTLGVSRHSSPAEARLEDQHGQAHYVMVEPDLEGEEFHQGDQILLVRRVGRRFFGIRNRHEVLVDETA